MTIKLSLFFAISCVIFMGHAQKTVKPHLESGLYTVKSDPNSELVSEEIIALRDEFSKTYRNSEGVYTKQSSDFPMHYRGNDGQWYTYDKQMTLAKTGLYTIEKTDVPISFNPSDGATIFGYNKSGGRLLFGQKTSFKITDKAGNVVNSSSDRNLASLRFDQEANRITQQNYWQGTDRRIKFDLSEVETDYVFNSKPSWLTQDQFVHFTEVYQIPSGASIVEGVGENGLFGFKGELTLRDANGEDLVLFNLPMCYDQTYLSEKYGKTTRPILGEYVYQIAGNELHLTTVVPASWILDDARVFPVVIDPTASSYQGGIYPFERYNYGCSYTVGVNVPAGTITGWYAQWQVTATGGGWMSEGRSQIGLNAAYQGQFQGAGYGGTYNVNTPTYTNNNGNWGGGTMTFWWRGYRTWGSICCCNTTYQRRNYLYVYVNYIDVPADPSAANSNVNPVCNPGQTITLTASNPVGTVYWYSGGCGATFIGTGTSINVNPNSTTTYFCRNYANGYFSNGCASTTVTVSGAPAAPTANPVSIFCGQTASLTASGNGSITWYANSNATGQLATGANYTTPVLNSSTTYYVNQTVSGCVSALTPVTVTANAPSTPTANNVSINCGQTASLSASSNGGLTWYSNSNGTGQLGTGSNYTTTPLSQNTTFYVQAGSAGCASQIVPVTVTVNALTAPSGTGATVNCGQTAALNAQGGNGTGYTWFSNANGTGQVGTGAAFTPPVLGATTTYYLAASTAIGAGNSQTFNFTGNVQTFTAPFTGSYTLEVWGARGGNDGLPGANGGYATGQVSLTAGQVINVYVGGQGVGCNSASGGGWNGGGNAGNAGCSGGGGGATDVRIGGNSLNDRVIVAGGGGGGGNSVQAGAGGGLVGVNGSGLGGTQAAGGAGSNPGSLGQGGHKTGDGGGGGGGYYGGGAAYGDDGGGGGSSYIGGVTNGSTIAGNASMPNPAGGNMNGNAGNGVVKITWSNTPCLSSLVPVTLTVTAASNPSVSNTTINCQTTATLSASSNSAIVWYSNANGSGQVGSGGSYTTPSLTASTTYYLQAGSGACASQLVPVTVTVSQAQAPSANNASINCQSSANLSTAANNSPLYWFSNANGSGQVGTGVSYTTPVLTSNTTYYLQAGSGACASQLVPVTVTVNSASNPSVNNASVNCGSTTTLTASSNAPIIWYSNANGTGQIGSGNSYTTGQIYAPTTYYLQAGAGACASQIIPVTAAPNVQQPSASNVSTNCATTATLTASGANSYVWYSDAAGTNQVGTNANFTTPVLNANTTYYVGGASAAAQSSTQVYAITSTAQLFNMGSSCGAGSFYNCGGGLRGFNWNDNLPAGTVVTNVQIQLSFGVKCSNGSVQTLLNNNNGSSITPNAHCNCSGTNNGIFTLNFPGNQYVVGGANQFRFNYNDCIGLFNGNGALSGQFARVTVTYQNQPCISPLVPVLVTVNQAQAPSAANQTVNCQSVATISGSSSSPITWFANANGSGQLATGANYTTPALNANTTYYMQAGTGACASQLVPVTVSVSAAQAPSANNVSTNCQTTATLNAGANNSPLYWFSNANGTGQVGTGASYTTPVLTGNTTYYLQAGTGACASQLVPVTVSVTQAQAPSVNNSSVNCGATATLTASANSPIYWFSNSNGTGQIGTGNSYTSGQAIYAPVTVYVQAGTGACASQLVPVTAAPNAAVPSVQNANTSCGSPVTLTASGANGYAWFSNANATGQVGNSANFTTPSLNNNTTYYVASITGGGVSNFSHTSATQSVYNNCGAANFVVPSTPAASSGATLTVYVRGDINSPGETVSVNSETGFLGNIWGGSQCGGFLSATYNISQATLSNWVANGSISLSFNSSCSVDNICGFAFQAYFTISYQSGSPACTSSVVPVQVTVNPLAAPTVSGNTTVCSNGSTTTTLTASGSPNGYAWFTNANGSGQVGSNASFTTPGLNANTTYYVQSTSNGCTSNLVPVNITVNALPAAPSANAPTICAGQTASINASANANWYTVPAGGASIGQAQNYTTPSLNNNVTYYMEGVNGPCVSATRTPVTVTVNASPSSNAGASIVGNVTCGKNVVNVGGNALAAGQTGQWTMIQAINNAGGFQGLFANGGTQANDQFTGTYGGTYVLKWAVTNSTTGCIGEDTMVVTFLQPNDASIAGLIGQGDVLWCGLTGSDWSTSTNWYLKQPANGNYPNGYYQRMSGAVQPAINSEVFSINQAIGGVCIGTNNIDLSAGSNAEDVFVGPGITLNLTNQTVNIAQNLTNNGTIIASTGTVNFVNNLNSTISGSGNTQLFNMTVNKSQGSTLTLQQPVLVTNTLTMTQGNVFTTNNNLLTLGTSSAAPGSLSYNTGTIVGPFKRYFTNAVTNGNEGLFPVGTSTYNRYASFSFGSTPGVDQFLTVEYVTGAPMQGGSALYNGLPCIASGALIQNYSADGYWSVVPTSNNYTAPITTAPYSVTLFANNLTGMQTPQICRIIKSAGSNNAAQHHVAWQGCGTHTAINAGVSPQAFAITSTAVQGFSWFNIGTSNNQALPVELVSFNGSCESEEVKLTWQTATEHNSSYYEVEKSRDGMEWQVLTTVTAAGNSTQLLNYETMDAHAMEGNNYYRLTQVDIDGTRKTYDAINVSCSGSTKGYFSAYPNPSTGAFQVNVSGRSFKGLSYLKMWDTHGVILLNRSIEVKPGINMFNVSDLNLAPGVYYLQIVNGERTTEVLKEVIR
jgi:hypothetical protein